MSDVLQNYVDGVFVDAHGTGRIDVVDPTTGTTVAVSPVSDATDVDRAFAAARAAFRSWKRTTPSERQLLLLRLADALEAHSDELVEAQHRNTGQPRQMIADEEVAAGADNLRFFAGAARTLEGKAAAE